MVHRRGVKDENGGLRTRKGDDGDPPVRVCDLGKHSARDGQALQGAGRGERVFPAADSHELFHEGSRACGGLCARSCRSNGGRRRNACGAACHPPHFRNDYRKHVFEMDSVLPRSADENQSVVQRNAVGENHAAVFKNERIFVAGGARRTPPRKRRKK